MTNTGERIFNTLVEVDADTGIPTGNTKPNVIGDPDYIPPTLDYVNCQTTTTTTTGVESIGLLLKNLGSQTLSFLEFKVWYKTFPGGFLQNSQVINAGDTFYPTYVNASDDFIYISGTVDNFSSGRNVRIRVYYSVNGGTRNLICDSAININTSFLFNNLPVPRNGAGSTDLIEIELLDLF